MVDSVFLPGGYPELHAGRLALATHFHRAMQELAGRDGVIYGECGGYMVLGQALIDQKGTAHKMLGLLDHVSSFKKRKLTLGYRLLQLETKGPLGKKGALFRGHEFHYATLTAKPTRSGLFRDLITGQIMGQQKGRICGSFGHLIQHETSTKLNQHEN